MEQLKPVMTRYLDVSKKLNDLNAQAAELRDQRRSIELDLTAVYAQTELPSKIELKNSQMVFQVKRPGEWKKGWTLSKKQLEQYLNEILPEHGADVFREIVMKHEPKMVGDDFGFELKPMHSQD
jgi:hypothetical protein